MSRKPAHDRTLTLKLIRDQAFRLFGRQGYEGVSIGDIAKATGLSKGALYWHFAGKTELYLDCQARLHGLFRRHIFEPMAATADPVASVLHLFHGMERIVGDPELAAGVGGYWLIPESAETEPVLKAQREFEAASAAVIAEVLRRGVAQKRFEMDGDVEDMSRAIITLMEAVVLPLRHRSPDEVHRMMAVLTRTLFRAYASDPALRKLAAP